MTFAEVLEATAILAHFEIFPKSRFIVIGKSEITFFISCSKRKQIFNYSWMWKTCSNKLFVL